MKVALKSMSFFAEGPCLLRIPQSSLFPMLPKGHEDM